MLKKIVFEDLVGAWLLLTGCLTAGLMVNELQPTPLPLVYSSPESRLNQTVEQLEPSTVGPIALDGDVDRNEMQKISSERLALILDARPEIFYRMGHIPKALSLPRDDFENRYKALQPVLSSYHDRPLIVYCSSSECPDSQMVADALAKLGFKEVHLFRGGWSDWDSAGLPEERE